MRFSVEQLQAISNLRGSSEFATVMNAIAKHCSTENERHLKATIGSEYLRGQVFALSDLLDSINSAQSKLQQHKQPKT